MANAKRKNNNLVYDKKNKVVAKSNTYKNNRPSNNYKKKNNNKNNSNKNNSKNKNVSNQKKVLELGNTGKILKQDIVNRKKQIDKKNNTTNNFNNANTKEKNKQKYESRQKRYANNNKNIKKPKVLDIQTGNLEKINQKIKEEQDKEKQLKKVTEEVSLKKKINKNVKSKEDEFRKKRQEFISDIKGKSSDNTIPLGSEKKDNKARVKRYLKESIVYAVIITIVNIIAIFVFDYVNYLKLFDIVIINYIITIILSLIINYAFAFFLDCLITEIWAKIKSRHKEGVIDGNNWLK